MTQKTTKMSTSDSTVAQRNWQFANGIEELPADNIYEYDAGVQRDIRDAKPWERDPHYFTEVRISALALLKMTIHARSGGDLEIMGLMQGKAEHHTLIVMDSFALPVEGTETRVNAQAAAYEYMTEYTITSELSTRKDLVIGWYHSHPGYGCWLSGIDVATQMLNQQYQEPWVAIVIDPIRTMSAGKVELGAFRTYPKGYVPTVKRSTEYQTIPLNKIEDFGVHADSYYQVKVSYFKSALDSKLLDTLWNSYWVNTLSTSPILTNAGFVTAQVKDLGGKLDQINGHMGRGRDNYSMAWAEQSASTSGGRKHAAADDKLTEAVKDAHRMTGDAVDALVTQSIKKAVFHHHQRKGKCCGGGAASITNGDVEMENVEEKGEQVENTGEQVDNKGEQVENNTKQTLTADMKKDMAMLLNLQH